MRKILFIDRDGTLIKEPPDQQIDSLHKFELVEHAISALLQLKNAGYRFVMVSNQDGLGTDSFPEPDFWPPQNLLLQILSSQGIALRRHSDRPQLRAPEPGDAQTRHRPVRGLPEGPRGAVGALGGHRRP